MKEDFLHFVWQFQLFEKQQCITTCGREFSVLRTGTKNFNAGPDFSSASIYLDNITWVGNIEVHIKSSDWLQHAHQHNDAYENVILHVVWKNDKNVLRKDGTPIPTFELEGKTKPQLVNKYENLLANPSIIPCENYFNEISHIIKCQALEKALMQRLVQKAENIILLLERNKGDWEETAYKALARNFGFKINGDAFERLAEITPLKIIQKHAGQLLQIEALLFGQAGWLNNVENDYTEKLKVEYQFLSHKYGLKEKQMGAMEWNMLRLRPANFPTFRMAQFAVFLNKNPNIFSTLFNWENHKDLEKIFSLRAIGFWENHYSFNSSTEKPTPAFGKTSFENIVINTVVPLLAAYSQVKGIDYFIEKAIVLLENLSAEKNNITSLWENIGLPVKNAFGSQASIELFNHFCKPRKCISCPIGASILNKI